VALPTPAQHLRWGFGFGVVVGGFGFSVRVCGYPRACGWGSGVGERRSPRRTRRMPASLRLSQGTSSRCVRGSRLALACACDRRLHRRIWTPAPGWWKSSMVRGRRHGAQTGEWREETHIHSWTKESAGMGALSPQLLQRARQTHLSCPAAMQPSGREAGDGQRADAEAPSLAVVCDLDRRAQRKDGPRQKRSVASGRTLRLIFVLRKRPMEGAASARGVKDPACFGRHSFLPSGVS